MSPFDEVEQARIDAAAAQAQAAQRPPHQRRGLIARAFRLFGLAGDVGTAAIALANAEVELARAALPWSVGWFCATLVFGVSLIGCGWLGILLLLYRWTNSLGVALAIMATVSAIVFAISAFLLLRTAHMLSFPESRHRIVTWLHRRPHDAKPSATATD